MDINYFEELWGKGKYKHPNEEAIWDARADAFASLEQPQENSSTQWKGIKFLMEEGILQADSAVLDIGCGFGEYVVDFARSVRQVIGTDISGSMLKNAKQHAEHSGVSNVSFVKVDWGNASLAQLDWHKKFDLVFSSMCPGVDSKETLEKMMDASQGYCFINQFVSGGPGICDELAELVGRKVEKTCNEPALAYIFNILYLMGYYPEVKYEELRALNKNTLPEAIEYYSRVLSQSSPLSDIQQGQVKQYLEKKAKEAVDGMITEIVKGKIAWLYWKV